MEEEVMCHHYLYEERGHLAISTLKEDASNWEEEANTTVNAYSKDEADYLKEDASLLVILT